MGEFFLFFTLHNIIMLSESLILIRGSSSITFFFMKNITIHNLPGAGADLVIAYQKYGRNSPFAWLHIPRVLPVAFIFGIAGGEQKFLILRSMRKTRTSSSQVPAVRRTSSVTPIRP